MKEPFFDYEDFYDPIQEGVYLDMSQEAAKECAKFANAKVQPLLEQAKRDVAQLAAMCNEVVSLRTEKQQWQEFAENQKKNWETSAVIVRNQSARITSLEAALRLIQSMCGNPDASEGCRLILNKAREALK